MRVFSVSRLTAIGGGGLSYEQYLLRKFKSSLLGYYTLGEASGASTAADSSDNAFTSAALAGVTFGTTGITNSLVKAATFSGATTGASYVQLEASPGTRFRAVLWSLAVWFKRNGAGIIMGASNAGTGTGGVFIEPLLGKGVAESETAGVNANYCMGLELVGSDYYVSADFEKGDTTETNRPTGRNGRMIDVTCVTATSTFTTRTDTGLATAFAHGFNNGDRVRFGATTIPTGLTATTSSVRNNWYYVINATSTTFQVSNTLGGSPVTITTTGTAVWINHCRATSTITSTDTNWHFAVATWDGTTLKTYLDGVLCEWDVPTMTPPEAVSSQLCCIGAGVSSTGTRTGAFNGVMQHASIWNRTLSDSEIKDLYNKGVEPLINVALPPVAALASDASIFSGDATAIVVQLADTGASTIDDTSVTSSTVVLKKNGVALTESVDYAFAYDSSTDRITLTPVGASTFATGNYSVVLN